MSTILNPTDIWYVVEWIRMTHPKLFDPDTLKRIVDRESTFIRAPKANRHHMDTHVLVAEQYAYENKEQWLPTDAVAGQIKVKLLVVNKYDDFLLVEVDLSYKLSVEGKEISCEYKSQSA